MSIFTDGYKNRLIKQYFYKPKAGAEIELQAATWEKSYDLLLEFPDQFDVDTAFGNQLDIIGRIVGIPRNVPFVLDKIRFGFDGDSSARGMADAFDSSVESAVLFDAFEFPYSSQQLDDEDFRFFIKAKIASNTASAYMSSDERISVNDSILTTFDGEAYAIDKKDMTLILYVSPAIDEERIRLVQQLDLLPKPQAVRYSIVRTGSDLLAFGFDGDSTALGFGDAFDSEVGGVMAEFIL
jgi:hypothetical protein